LPETPPDEITEATGKDSVAIGKEIIMNQMEFKNYLQETKQMDKIEQAEPQSNIKNCIKSESQAGVMAGKKEAEVNRNLILEDTLAIKKLIVAEEVKQEERYLSTYKGLKTIHEENQEEIIEIKEIKRKQERIQIMNADINNKVTSNEEGSHHIDNNVEALKRLMEEKFDDNHALYQIDENIEKLKKVFEERITEMQAQIIRTGTDTTRRVVEVLENGKELIGQAITTKNTDQQTQEAHTRNMINFINTSTEEIKEMIIKNNRQTEFGEYIQKIYEDQRRDTEKLEAQHNAIFEKEEENRMILGEAKLELDRIVEMERSNGENQLALGKNQERATEKIEASQNEIKNTLEIIKEGQLIMKKELEKESITVTENRRER
jgi:hypothetical protein